MKKAVCMLIAFLAIHNLSSFAQQTVTHKAGNLFYVSLPDYLTKTRGLNSAATIQYKNVVKEVYGFIIEDTKENLAMDEIHFSSIDEFFQDFISGFVKNKDKLNALKPTYEKRSDLSFATVEYTSEATESMPAIYYLLGLWKQKTVIIKC